MTDRHEHWKTDLFVNGKPGRDSEKTPDYAAWLKALPEAEAAAFQASDNPYYVGKKLDSFYEFKTKAAKAKTDKEDRLKGAITPQGVARAAPQAMSDEEAMRKGFAEGFKTS